jgi:hypothetical protein
MPALAKDDIDSALFLRDLGIQAVPISQLRNIALHCSYIPPNQVYGCVQFFLMPSRDEDICAFRNKLHCRRQSNAAITTSNECYLSF